VWGVPYLFIKLAVAEIPPAWVAWGRITLGALVLVPIAWKRGALRPVLARKGATVAFALTELAIPFFLIALGERWVSSSLAGILIATVPLAVVGLSPLFGIKERLGASRLLGLAVGFIGVIVLLGIDPVDEALQWAGITCLLVSAVLYAVGALIVQRHLSDVDEVGAVALSLVVAAIVLSPVAALSVPTQMPSVLAWTSIFVLGIVCTALGLLLYFYVLVTAGAARATVVTYINPAVAAVLGVLVLQEEFGPSSMAGLLLILFGSWLATRKQGPPQAQLTGARLQSARPELGATDDQAAGSADVAAHGP
jgi:drug/metabolite transporter (DMT)-like permease